MAQAVEEKFHRPYRFVHTDVVVVIRHALDGNLRHKVGHPKEIDPNGGFGKFAQWKTELTIKDSHIECKFKNVHSGHYLRITDQKTVDCAGEGGAWCVFVVHMQNLGVVKLESQVFEGQYIAVDKEGVRVGKGGPWCRLRIFREGDPPPFSKPFMFAGKAVCVIEHRNRDYLCLKGKNDTHIHTDDTEKGEGARFEVVPDGPEKCQIKSVLTGQYLRIFRGGVDCAGKGGPWTVFKVLPVDVPNQVRLESEKCPGEFVTLDGKGLKVGDGKHKHSFFTFYCD